jgi:hypothetical protein
MNTITKGIATGVIAALLVPTLAFADNDNRGKASLELRIQKGIERIEKKGQHNDKREERLLKHASTTAAKITAKAQGIQAAANTMLSFETRIGGLIASSSVEGKAALETKFAQFKQSATSSVSKAQSAINLSAQANASTTASSTNAALLAQAKVELKEAKGFLHEAKKVLFSILRSLWR